MHKQSVPNMSRSQRLSMKCSQIWLDFRARSRDVFLFFGFIFVYMLISAELAVTFTDGFITTARTWDENAKAWVVKQSVASLGHADAFYFTVISMTTVGFGDIFPVTFEARLLGISNAIVGLLSFAILVGIMMRDYTSKRHGAMGHRSVEIDTNRRDGAALANLRRYQAIAELRSRIDDFCRMSSKGQDGQGRAPAVAATELDKLRLDVLRSLEEIRVMSELVDVTSPPETAAPG
jgi:hypothetical protein